MPEVTEEQKAMHLAYGTRWDHTWVATLDNQIQSEGMMDTLMIKHPGGHKPKPAPKPKGR